MGFLTDGFQQMLMFLVQTTGSLGYAIIVFTFLIRSALLPLTIPSLRSAKKMQQIQPELKMLSKKHGKDRQGLQKAQMELYKKYNVNPLSGCVPQLLQLGVLILIYQSMINFINNNGGLVNMNFFWLDLSIPDSKYVLPILAVLTQLVLSLMIAPGAEIPDVVPNKAKTNKIKKANEKEEDTADMAKSMQQQMMFLMPLITGFIALSFPSGLALYWVATTIFSIGQQWYVTGPGGLVTYTQRAKALITTKLGK